MRKKQLLSEINEIVIYEQSFLKKILTNSKYGAEGFEPNNPKQMQKLNEKIKNRHHIIYVKSVEKNG